MPVSKMQSKTRSLAIDLSSNPNISLSLSLSLSLFLFVSSHLQASEKQVKKLKGPKVVGVTGKDYS